MAVVFDCDGVLVDSETAWFLGIVEVFRRHGVSELAPRPGSDLRGASVSQLVLVLENELGVPLDRRKTEEEIYDAIVTAIREAGVTPMEGAVELLEALAGTRPLAIASNGSRQTVEAALEAASIPPVFDAIVAFEPPFRPKPAPDLYLEACRLLEVAPGDSTGVEDSATGASAARAAGLFVVGVGPAGGLPAVCDLVVPRLNDDSLVQHFGLKGLVSPPRI